MNRKNRKQRYEQAIQALAEALTEEFNEVGNGEYDEALEDEYYVTSFVEEAGIVQDVVKRMVEKAKEQ